MQGLCHLLMFHIINLNATTTAAANTAVARWHIIMETLYNVFALIVKRNDRK
jgi:hypothetical protein